MGFDLKKPPNWEMWNSSASRKFREENGWHDEMLALARRHVQRPVVQEYQNDIKDVDLTALGQLLQTLGTEINRLDFEVHSSLSSLGAEMASEPVVASDIVSGLFPCDGAFTHRDFRYDADPENFLFCIWSQIGWRAVREGWALCIAEDGFQESYCSWIPPEDFPVLTEDNNLVHPKDVGVQNWVDLNYRVQEQLHAKLLRFVLVRNVVACFPENGKIQTSDQSANESKVTSSYSGKGYDRFDAPFIQEGLEMIEKGIARNPNDAAVKLVAKYKVRSQSDCRLSDDQIPAISKDAATQRLQRKISKARKPK